MPARPQHGRRRATSTNPSPASRGRHWPAATDPAPRRGRGRKQLGVVVVAGVIALTALPVAHAESHRLSSAVTAAAPAPAASLQPAVTADKDAVVVFATPVVRSKPAPSASPAGALQPAAARQAPLPAQGPTTAPEPAPAAAAPSPAAGTPAGLRPPLASLTVTSPFGYRTNPLSGAGGELHTGIDFAGACGTAVFAAGAGAVTEADWSQYGGGNRIVIDHGGGIKTTYNHLESIGVSVGQQVGAGAQIAGVGSTGNSTGCHLHFEVMVNDQTVDPAPFI